MNYDIRIEKLDETFMKVICKESYIEMEIQDRFSFEVPNAKFDPRVINGQWDGIKKLYNRRSKTMYVGLLLPLLTFIEKMKYTYKCDEKLFPSSNVEMDDIKHIVEEFIKPHSDRNPLAPADHQYEALHYMLNMDRSLPVVATSGGKSLILYIATRIYQMCDDMHDKKIIIIVPSKMLVEQMYSDFEDYSTYDNSSWNVKTFCQKVNGDYSKTFDKQIIITTWQSLKDIPIYHIRDAGAIFCDEVHTAKGNVLTKLMESASNCPIRHGVTGSLDKFEANELHVQGLFGPKKKVITAKQLINKGWATPLKINALMLDYSMDLKREYDYIMKEQKKKKVFVKNGKTRSANTYNTELEFIYGCHQRRKFLYNLIDSLDGNTLILFDRVEKYGNIIYEEYSKLHKNTFLITGDVDQNIREEVRTTMENYDDAVIFASSSIFSTGISIKKLHNLIFASSSKSVIRIIQSLGRMLRKHKTKEFAIVYDIIDKIDYKKNKNHVLKHAEDRIKIYADEGHKVKFYPIDLK